MGKNTSIALGERYEHFIQEIVSEGRYKNASEVIRAGLRLLETEEQKFIALQQAINEGIDSGIVVGFEPDEHLKQLKLQRKKNA